MLEYLKYDENNVKTVCEMDGFHADMGMNIWVRILQPGQKLDFCSDTLEFVEGRHYIKATASLINAEDGQQVTTTAYAREEESKKGMDGSQVTGASSSYARKYALNGMFCIDDTKDSDSTNDHGKGGGQPEVKKNPVGSAVAAAQAAKPQVNPKYKAVWKSYCEHPANAGLEPQQLKDGFNNLRTSIIGKEKKAADYTDDDWDKLASAIAELDDDLPY